MVSAEGNTITVRVGARNADRNSHRFAAATCIPDHLRPRMKLTQQLGQFDFLR